MFGSVRDIQKGTWNWVHVKRENQRPTGLPYRLKTARLSITKPSALYATST